MTIYRSEAPLDETETETETDAERRRRLCRQRELRASWMALAWMGLCSIGCGASAGGAVQAWNQGAHVLHGALVALAAFLLLASIAGAFVIREAAE